MLTPPLNARYTPMTATTLRLDEGLYAMEISEIAAAQSRAANLLLPLTHVAAPRIGHHPAVEIIGTSVGRRTWLGPEGGTIGINSSPGAGPGLITTYGVPDQAAAPARVEVCRLDWPRSRDKALERGVADEIQTELTLPVERLGDQRVAGRGWVDNCGQKLRIAAFGGPTDRDPNAKLQGARSGRPTNALGDRQQAMRDARPRLAADWLCNTSDAKIRKAFDITYQGRSSKAELSDQAKMGNSVSQGLLATRSRQSTYI